MAANPPNQPAPAGQNIAQTIGQTIGHIMPAITNIHAWFWILVVATVGVHLFAGLSIIVFGKFGKLAMLFIEVSWMVVIWAMATHPVIIATELAASAFATAGSGTFGESASDIMGGWLKKVASINAYIIGIPATAMLLLDIKQDGASMVALLLISIVLIMVTMTVSPESKTALELAQAGLIGSCVKIAFSLLAPMEGSGAEAWVINTLIEEARLAGIAVALLAFFGSERVKGWILWLWTNVIMNAFKWLHPKNVIKTLGGVIVLGVALFAVYWFTNPISASKIAQQKFDTIERATNGDSSRSAQPGNKLSPTHTGVGNAESVHQSEATATSPQLPIDESQWELVAEKTCTIDPESPWNNKDFKEGWCSLGTFEPGKYRFRVASSIQDKHLNGSYWKYPPEGISTDRWRSSNNKEFADYFEQWSMIKNKKVGMVIFKIGDFLVDKWEASLEKEQSIATSLNSQESEENWKTTGFHGKITIQVFKKKI